MATTPPRRRSSKRTAGLCLLLCVLTAAPALALAASDFRSAARVAILYDQPSLQSAKRLIAARGTPLEVIQSQGAWYQVRDPGGAMTWIEAGALSSLRTVMVTTDDAEIRSAADLVAPVVFTAARNLILQAQGEPVDGWLPVRHEDGTTGFVRVIDIWGL